MSAEPVIAFGQQPCGFFPRRFLVAKIRTARRLQAEIGGRVVYFCHDSDHDPRETRTILRHRATGQPAHPPRLQRGGVELDGLRQVLDRALEVAQQSADVAAPAGLGSSPR